jgi:tetratricopeptide (TPR) repeat protein
VGSSTDLWELQEALQGRTVGERGMALIELTTRDLDRIYAQTPPVQLMPEVRAQLGKVVEYLGWPQPAAYRRRLCGVAGRLAGLIGWLHFDLADTRTAEAWYLLAIDAAREAENWSLAGWLYGGRSLIPFQQGVHRDAATLVKAARELCPASADPTVHAWLAALHARALAGVGDHAGFEREFAHAAALSPTTDVEERRHGMDFYNGRLDLNYYRGGGLLALSRPVDAAEALRLALDILPVTRPKARAVLTLGLAEAAVNGGGLDEAADLLRRALATTQQQPIMPIVAMARTVAAALDERGFRSASIVDELDSMNTRLAIQSGARP